MTTSDTWETRWAQIQEAAAFTPQGMTPVYILSHARIDVPTIQAIPGLVDLNEITLVVPSEVYPDYELAWGDEVEVLAVPENYLGVGRGVAQARQFVLDTALDRGQDVITLLDDDITGIAAMYQGDDGKASSAYVKRVGDERDLYSFGTFALAVQSCMDVMDAYPEVALAGPQNRNDQRTLEAALTAYDLNYGRMPIGFVVWHVPRFMEMTGGLRMSYNRHGEDLWATMSVLHAGGWYARIPSVLVSFYDEHTQSTLKDPESEKAVRNAEGDRVAGEPWFEKLRIKRYPDGSYHGGAPNMKKFRDTAPFRRVLWSGQILEKPVAMEVTVEPREGVTMKVNINEQIEISDEQRFMLGAVLSGALKPKKFASRDEIKTWAWEHGASWDTDLVDAHKDRFQAELPADENDDPMEDLLGDIETDTDDEYSGLL